eukprot:5644-Heterococcus_DN1.PRE.3
MVNKGVLRTHLPLPSLPDMFGSNSSSSSADGIGTTAAAAARTTTATTAVTVSGAVEGGSQRLTKSLEWSIHFCVLNHMFNHKRYQHTSTSSSRYVPAARIRCSYTAAERHDKQHCCTMYALRCAVQQRLSRRPQSPCSCFQLRQFLADARALSTRTLRCADTAYMHAYVHCMPVEIAA